jgi:hypothetical protein
VLVCGRNDRSTEFFDFDFRGNNFGINFGIGQDKTPVGPVGPGATCAPGSGYCPPVDEKGRPIKPKIPDAICKIATAAMGGAASKAKPINTPVRGGVVAAAIASLYVACQAQSK